MNILAYILDFLLPTRKIVYKQLIYCDSPHFAYTIKTTPIEPGNFQDKTVKMILCEPIKPEEANKVMEFVRLNFENTPPTNASLTIIYTDATGKPLFKDKLSDCVCTNIEFVDICPTYNETEIQLTISYSNVNRIFINR